jgi:hypothetical protein
MTIMTVSSRRRVQEAQMEEKELKMKLQQQ